MFSNQRLAAETSDSVKEKQKNEQEVPSRNGATDGVSSNCRVGRKVEGAFKLKEELSTLPLSI